jgi:mono/diheme cytochrome c family protein
MISIRKPLTATDVAARVLAATASLLMIGTLVGCGQGRTTGNGMPGTTTPGTTTPGTTTPGTTTPGTTTPGETTPGGTTVVNGSAGAGMPSGAGASTGTMVQPPPGGTGDGTMPMGTGTPPVDTNTGLPTPSCGDATAQTAGAAPPIFVTECASCHGMTADGRSGYPSLRRADMTLADMTAIVRGGKTSTTTEVTSQGKTIPLRMPAFSTNRLTDADIGAIFAWRGLAVPAGQTAPVPAVYCLSRPEATWTQDQINTAYTNGLTAWRTPGEVDNNACVGCHAADPMDLAYIGYSDAQMYRRAFSHVQNQATIDAVIDMVHALRAKYNIVQPPNPVTYRPFQPGGAVLPGNSAQERDQAFGQELSDMKLRLMGAPINSVADAKQAWTELAALDLRALKVGIPVNKYTEDKFNNDGVNVPCPDKHACDDHGTIADWITDTAVVSGPLSAAQKAAEDAYLANPTLDTLKAAVLTRPRDETSWFRHKYGSVELANYLFRLQAQGDTNLSKFVGTYNTTNSAFPVDMKTGMLYNTIWMVGANQRDFIHNVGATLPVGGLGNKFSVPPETIPGLTRNDANEQLQRIIVPWFWLGFSFDPSTMMVEPDYVAEGDEYFTQETFLDNGSSPIHGAFIVSKRSVEVMKYDAAGGLPRSPNVFPFSHPDLGRFPVTPLVMRSGYFPIVTNFAEQKNFNTINNYQIMYMPSDNATHKTLYETYAANQWRMFMWTLIGELQATPQIWNRNILGGKINKAEIFLTQPDVVAANGAMDKAMLAQARSLVGSATGN